MKIDLSENAIEGMVTIPVSMPLLEVLSLGHNNITGFQFGANGSQENHVTFPVLETLNLSFNQIQSLPCLSADHTPQLLTLLLQSNFISCQQTIFQSLLNNPSITQLDLRDNPVTISEGLEEALLSMYKLERINGKAINAPGSKYLEQGRDLLEHMGGLDDGDEQDRKIRLSGFYNDEIQHRMSGMKPNRPTSATKRGKKQSDPNNIDELEAKFNEFMCNDRRIREIREEYLAICERNGVKAPDRGKQEAPPSQGADSTVATPESSPMLTEPQPSPASSIQFLRSQNEASSQQWGEAKRKQKEKLFNIRDVMRRSLGRFEGPNISSSGNIPLRNGSAVNTANPLSQTMSNPMNYHAQTLRSTLPELSGPNRTVVPGGQVTPSRRGSAASDSNKANVINTRRPVSMQKR